MTVDGVVAILHTGMVIAPLLRWVRALPATVDLALIEGLQIPRQRNMALGRAAAVGAGWVLFVDSDCLPPFDALPRLLARDAGVVSAVVCERTPPFRSTAVRSLDPPRRWNLDQLPRDDRLLPVEAAGAGCLLIRRTVWEAMESPWFRCGQVVSDLLLEDTEFCLRAAAAGFPAHVDCSVRVGHRVVGGMLWPGRDGRHWMEYPGPGDTRVPLDVSAVAGEAR